MGYIYETKIVVFRLETLAARDKFLRLKREGVLDEYVSKLFENDVLQENQKQIPTAPSVTEAPLSAENSEKLVELMVERLKKELAVTTIQQVVQEVPQTASYQMRPKNIVETSAGDEQEVVSEAKAEIVNRPSKPKKNKAKGLNMADLVSKANKMS